MFSQYRFVLVSEADHMDERKVEVMMGYIENPSPTTCSRPPWSDGTSLEETSERDRKGRESDEYSRLKGRALVSWMKNRMKEKGKTLSEEAADYLVEVVGDHLHDLDNALEKVFLSVGGKQHRRAFRYGRDYLGG